MDDFMLYGISSCLLEDFLQNEDKALSGAI